VASEVTRFRPPKIFGVDVAPYRDHVASRPLARHFVAGEVLLRWQETAIHPEADMNCIEGMIFVAGTPLEALDVL